MVDNQQWTIKIQIIKIHIVILSLKVQAKNSHDVIFDIPEILQHDVIFDIPIKNL